MKVRIKFTKTGPLKFIGHLDVMRYFQKLLRRAEIPVKYSEGFSPHQILSFSHPLPLGMESLGEYADIELEEEISSENALERIKNQSVPMIEVLSFKKLPDRCDNAMASVCAAKYRIEFKGKCPFSDLEKLTQKVLDSSELIVFKKTKKSEKYENIRSGIYEIKALPQMSGFEVLLSSGSINNIKPELVIDAMAQIEKICFDKDNLYITRLDQYTNIDDKLISLDDIGENIQ